MYDPNREMIIDVLPDKRLERLKGYFLDVPRKERINVKYVNRYNYFTKRKNIITSDIINQMMSLDEDLEEAYDILQSFYITWKNIKYEDARKAIDEWLTIVQLANIPKDNEVVTMFRHWKDEIINSFIMFGDRRLHNDMERINNRIKV